MRSATAVATWAIVAVLAGGAPVHAQHRFAIRFRGSPGAAFTYVLQQTTRTTFDNGEVLGVWQRMWVSEVVEGDSGGATSVAFSVDSLQVGTPASPRGLSDQQLAIMREFKGHLRFNSRMEVVRAGVAGWERMPADLGPLVTDAVLGMFPTLPPSRVAPGDSWTTRIKVPGVLLPGVGTPLLATVRLRLVDVEIAGADTLARIGVRIMLPQEPFEEIRGGERATFQPEGSLAGGYVVSLPSGLVRTGQLHGQLRVTITFQSSGARGSFVIDHHSSLRLVRSR